MCLGQKCIVLQTCNVSKLDLLSLGTAAAVARSDDATLVVTALAPQPCSSSSYLPALRPMTAPHGSSTHGGSYIVNTSSTLPAAPSSTPAAQGQPARAALQGLTAAGRPWEDALPAAASRLFGARPCSPSTFAPHQHRSEKQPKASRQLSSPGASSITAAGSEGDSVVQQQAGYGDQLGHNAQLSSADMAWQPNHTRKPWC
ncbi:hypothetical protein QJQ45_018642 [Haematococcus lacustris]|nr:hypothetical protein QJQ45_018642 [Haematococcus lacustris]